MILVISFCVSSGKLAFSSNAVMPLLHIYQVMFEVYSFLQILLGLGPQDVSRAKREASLHLLLLVFDLLPYFPIKKACLSY